MRLLSWGLRGRRGRRVNLFRMCEEDTNGTKVREKGHNYTEGQNGVERSRAMTC